MRYMTKLVEWPVVESVPLLSDVHPGQPRLPPTTFRKHIIITRPSSSLFIDDPGAADLARGPAAPPACTACTLRVLSALPTRALCAAYAFSLPPPCGLHALSLHYSARHHLPTQRCVGAMAPRPPATLRAQATTCRRTRSPLPPQATLLPPARSPL